MDKMTSKSNYEEIVSKLLRNPKEVCKTLNLPYNEYPNRIAMVCPVHEGASEDMCAIFTKGNTAVGNWVCWSGNCHIKYGRDIVGFIRGVLSTRLEREVTRKEVISDFADLASQEVNYEKITEEAKEEIKINSVHGLTRKNVIKSLMIPSPYFLQRGYSKEILAKYDVGECFRKGRQMFLRAVVPVYDFNYDLMGITGRSIQPECSKCGYYHFENLECPRNQYEKYLHTKWINNKGFNKNETFYNLIHALEHIRKLNYAILVEGPGDVWRLEESGIHNSLGMFGLSLTQNQLKILEKIGVKNIVCLTDNDNSGLLARKSIEKTMRDKFKVTYPEIKEKDVGEMNVEQVQQILLPQLKKLES